ncbi:MAG: S8 family serine peptidase [Caldisericia bacterium]
MRKIKFAVVVFVLFALLVMPVVNVNGFIPEDNDVNRYIVELNDYSRFPNSYPLMLMSHANFKANLAMVCPDAYTLFEYDTGISGFSVSCSDESIKKISSFEDVKSVTMVRYAYPHLFNSVETTGATEVWQMRDDVDKNITGDGTLVGIIDTGVHYYHPSLGGGFGDDYKVCVGYNFVDYSADPYPMGAHSHGTHCAGIVAATGLPGIASGEPTPTGIAPDAKIGAYNVFGSRGGAPMDAVMMALEQAFEDGCDVVNLSLGSEYVWADEPYCKLIDNLVDKGMVVVGSAGNEGRNSREDLPFQVSSPGGAEYSISVAAMNDAGITVFYYGDESFIVQYMSFSEEVENKISGELVYCEKATVEDVEDLDLKGAVALVERGDLTFFDKAKNVEAQGAVACVVFNNKPGEFGGTLGSKGISIPVIAISDEVGAELLEYAGEEVTFKYDERLGLMTEFSSPGPTNDYRLKPDMSAPGFQVLSTVYDESYERYNGTSMASPTVAGGRHLLSKLIQNGHLMM